MVCSTVVGRLCLSVLPARGRMCLGEFECDCTPAGWLCVLFSMPANRCNKSRLEIMALLGQNTKSSSSCSCPLVELLSASREIVEQPCFEAFRGGLSKNIEMPERWTFLARTDTIPSRLILILDQRVSAIFKARSSTRAA